MDKSQDKVLYSTPTFDVIEREGFTGIKSTVEPVVILPYISDDQGLPLMLGVLKERNPYRDGGYSIAPITGTSDEEDPDYLSTAKRELKEESGYEIDDNSKWFFLGTVTATTDGSEQEKLSKFVFIPANDVVKSKDVFIPALFLKLFKFVVGMDLYNREDSVFSSPKGFNTEI